MPTLEETLKKLNKGKAEQDQVKKFQKLKLLTLNTHQLEVRTYRTLWIIMLFPWVL